MHVKTPNFNDYLGMYLIFLEVLFLIAKWHDKC